MEYDFSENCFSEIHTTIKCRHQNCDKIHCNQYHFWNGKANQIMSFWKFQVVALTTLTVVVIFQLTGHVKGIPGHKVLPFYKTSTLSPYENENRNDIYNRDRNPYSIYNDPRYPNQYNIASSSTTSIVCVITFALIATVIVG